MKTFLLATIACLGTMPFAATGQVRYEWREMASLDVYDATVDQFWNRYSHNKEEIRQNVLRARKLGFNMVRIPLNFIPRDIDHLYDHGWPDSTDAGKGKVFAHPTPYLQDVTEMIDFCLRLNLKVDLILFNHGLSSMNCAGYHHDNPNLDRCDSLIVIYDNYYSGLDPAGSDCWIEPIEMNGWFVDASRWLDSILTYVDQQIGLEKIEVCELQNEAAPQDAIDANGYPGSGYYYPLYFYDVFLLEMTNYINHKWPEIKLMVSIGQKENLRRFENLRDMVAAADAGTYIRPAWMNYDDSPYDSVFFDYLSFHNYNTYSYRKSFQDVLDLGELQPRPVHGTRDYGWHLGEMGFDIGTANSYETDQAKFFQSNLQIADQFYGEMKSTSHPLKGIGIWSVFDYEYSGEPGVHYGLISSGKNPVRKRKAAYIIENAFEGYVDNADFEIGPGNDPNFDDSPWCNGWTAWYPTCCQSYNSEHYSYMYDSAERGHVLALSPAPFEKIGWSSSPGGMIRVKPGTNITIRADIWFDSDPGDSAKIFIHLPWVDLNGIPIDTSACSGQVDKTVFGWRTVSATFSVPADACFTTPTLMAWNSRTETRFDNVTYAPDWRPLISFTFEDDMEYFPGQDDSPAALGWTSEGESFRTNGILYLKRGANIRSTHVISNPQITGIRMRPQRYYAVDALASSHFGTLKTRAIISGRNDFPGSQLYRDDYGKSTIVDSLWQVMATSPILSNGSEWLEIELMDSSAGFTRVKEVTVFEAAVQ